MKKLLSIPLLVTVGITLLVTPVIAKEGAETRQNQNQYEGTNGDQYQSRAQNGYQHGFLNRYYGTYGIDLYQKDPTDWSIIDNGVYGHIQWSAGGFAFNGYNLIAEQEYTLLIFEDITQIPWEYNITILGTGIPTAYGDETYLAIEGEANIYDYSGLKIWLVPSNDLTGEKFNTWNPGNYLFEYEFIP